LQHKFNNTQITQDNPTKVEEIEAAMEIFSQLGTEK